jgi:hypothetical protein
MMAPRRDWSRISAPKRHFVLSRAAVNARVIRAFFLSRAWQKAGGIPLSEPLKLIRKLHSRLTQPPVFDLFIVNRCALRLCFFLASRASANLSTTPGLASFFVGLMFFSFNVSQIKVTTFMRC